MDTLNLAQQWAKAEIFSSKFFIAIAIVFFAASIGFWLLGKSEMAKSYIIPTIVCGSLMLIVGVGLVYNNHSRVKTFAEDYKKDKIEFLNSELERTEKTIAQTDRTIYKILPILIIVAAVLIIFMTALFWRAWCITFIAMLALTLIVDSNSQLRIINYNKDLKTIEHGNLD